MQPAVDPQFEESVKKLFESIEEKFPGVAEGMRVLNMSCADYLNILQDSQPNSSFVANGTVTLDR